MTHWPTTDLATLTQVKYDSLACICFISCTDQSKSDLITNKRTTGNQSQLFHEVLWLLWVCHGSICLSPLLALLQLHTYTKLQHQRPAVIMRQKVNTANAADSLLSDRGSFCVFRFAPAFMKGTPGKKKVSVCFFHRVELSGELDVL